MAKHRKPRSIRVFKGLGLTAQQEVAIMDVLGTEVNLYPSEARKAAKWFVQYADYADEQNGLKEKHGEA